jgi:hypothetical protein
MDIKIVNERTDVVVINGNLELPDLTQEEWSQFRMANRIECQAANYDGAIVMSKEKLLSYKNTRIIVKGHVYWVADYEINLRP